MAVGNLIRGPLTIAVYTWREGIRKKTLVGFLILSLLVIFGSTFMSAFLGEARSAGNIESEVETKLIKDICVSAIAIFGVLITIFISASVVPAEMENKVVYTILSKPIRRSQYLLGKFVGIQFIVIVNLLLMTMLFFITLWVKERIMPTLLLWSALLTYFQFLIVSAFTFAISCTSTSSVLPTIGGLFIYITGNLTEYLKDVANRVGEANSTADMLVARLAAGLYQVLPNLRNFDMKAQILNMQPNDPPTDVQFWWLLRYGLVYAFAGYVLAYWLFRRKEL